MKQTVLPEQKIIQKVGISANQEIIALKGQITKLSDTIKEQQEELSNKVLQIDVLNTELVNTNIQHQSEIESINQAHAGEIEQLNTNHSNHISQLVNDYEDQIEGIEQGYIDRDNELMVIINDINTLL